MAKVLKSVVKEINEYLHRSNVVFDFEDDTVYIQFNENTENFEFGTASNSGMIVDLRVPYDPSESVQENIEMAIEEAREYYEEAKERAMDIYNDDDLIGSVIPIV